MTRTVRRKISNGQFRSEDRDQFGRDCKYVIGDPLFGGAQQLNIHLTFDQQYDRISPRPGPYVEHVQIDARLNLNGKVTQTSIANEANLERTLTRNDDDIEGKLGSSSWYEWKVVDRNKLIYIVDFGGFKRAILLTVNGSTCAAQVDYELKPDFVN